MGECNYNVNYDTTGNNIRKRESDQTGKENNDVEYTLLRNEIIDTIEKTDAISMNERENLTKVKVQKSQEKYLNFANLAFQEFCDDIELDMNDVNRMMLMFVQKQLNLNLELNRERKENMTKIKNQSGKLI